MRQRLDRKPFMPGHILRGDHRVDDGFLGRIGGGGEQRVNEIVAQGLNGCQSFFPPRAVLGLAVEKARKMSPEPLPPSDPVRAMPSEARRARRLS